MFGPVTSEPSITVDGEFVICGEPRLLDEEESGVFVVGEPLLKLEAFVQCGSIVIIGDAMDIPRCDSGGVGRAIAVDRAGESRADMAFGWAERPRV